MTTLLNHDFIISPNAFKTFIDQGGKSIIQRRARHDNLYTLQI